MIFARLIVFAVLACIGVNSIQPPFEKIVSDRSQAFDHFGIQMCADPSIDTLFVSSNNKLVGNGDKIHEFQLHTKANAAPGLDDESSFSAYWNEGELVERQEPLDEFGASVCACDGWVYVGAPNHRNSPLGKASGTVFAYPPKDSLVSSLRPSPLLLSAPPTSAASRFGSSVSCSPGGGLLIGAESTTLQLMSALTTSAPRSQGKLRQDDVAATFLFQRNQSRSVSPLYIFIFSSSSYLVSDFRFYFLQIYFGFNPLIERRRAVFKVWLSCSADWRYCCCGKCG